MTTPIISATDLGEYLRIPTPDADLAAIACDAATQVVVDYIDQDPNLGTASAKRFDGTGSIILGLAHRPISAVTTVDVYDADLQAYETLTEDLDFVVDYDRGVLFRIDGDVWTGGRQNIEVTYDYGSATVNSAIRLVALQVAARIYDVGMVSTESLGGYSATYVEGAGTLNDAERLALYPHKRSVV